MLKGALQDSLQLRQSRKSMSLTKKININKRRLLWLENRIYKKLLLRWFLKRLLQIKFLMVTFIEIQRLATPTVHLRKMHQGTLQHQPKKRHFMGIFLKSIQHKALIIQPCTRVQVRRLRTWEKRAHWSRY